MRKVAIGLPVHNGENFLAEAIESILAQTFTDFELVISDNASTDGTEAICRDYALRDSRILYVRQPVDIGAIPNFNSLVGLSRSEYFKWAAHDDVLAPTFLEQCVTALDADPAVVLAMPATALINHDGSPLVYSPTRREMIDSAGFGWSVQPEKNRNVMSSDPAKRFEAIVLHTHLCAEIFGLIRRSTLARTPLQGAFLGGDKILLAQLSLLGPFWAGEEPLFFRRCHIDQYSSAAKSGEYRAEWFWGSSGRTFLHRALMEKAQFLTAYCNTVLSNSRLSRRQRAACLGVVAQRALWRGKALATGRGFYLRQRA